MFLGTGVFPRDFKQQRNNNREEINKNKRTKYDRIKLNEKKKDEWKGGKETRAICGLVAAGSFVLLTGSIHVTTTLIRSYHICVESLLQITVS
jgi:hypothetical protein